MLRDLLDLALLEDFADGLAHAARLRVGIFDAAGQRITAAPVARNAAGDPTHLELAESPELPAALPAKLELSPVRAHQPPGRVAFVADNGLACIVAPVQLEDELAGYVACGPFRDPASRSAQGAFSEPGPTLLPLERGGESWSVSLVRWAARMLADWCRHELQINTAAQEVALVSDIGELLSGAGSLQQVLNRIVEETARVMRCQYASLRLYDELTDELRIAAVYQLSSAYVPSGAILRSASPIDDEALRGQVVYIEDAQSDPRFRSVQAARELGIVSGLTAGMLYHGKPVGVLRIYARRKRRFRTAQRNLLRAVASQAATAVVNARLVEERLRAERIERQLELAADVQARMVRLDPPPHPRIDSAVVFEPSSHVAGDFCDLFDLPDGRRAAVVGDVAGHGIPAALMMASVRGALRAIAENCFDLGQILTRLNRRTCQETGPGEFVTLVMIAINVDGTEMGVACAGHESPLLCRAGQVHAIDHGSLVLGMRADERYTETTVPLRPADQVLLYTDGLIEARDFQDRAFGRERLAAALREFGALPPESMLQNIRWNLRRFVGLAEREDDLTMVGLRIRLPDERSAAPTQVVRPR